MNKYEKAVVAAEKKEAIASEALNRARLAVQKHCSHPEDARRETRTEDDDGYGRWFTRVGEQCKLCGQTRTYKGRGDWLKTSYFLKDPSDQ